MEREDDIHDELEHIAPGFPKKRSLDPPPGYFDTFSEEVLNRWRKEVSHPMRKMITLKRVIGIAAVLTGLCIGGWYIFNHAPNQRNEITSAEAYQYIHEHIDEFEPLIEVGDILVEENQIDVSKEAVDEYLLEEMQGSDPEDLF